MSRNFSSTAVRTTLTAAVTASATTLTVASLVGHPTSFPYTLVIDPDTALEELVDVTAASGLSLTVTRGADGTSGQAHAVGADAWHAVSARDFQEPADHIDATIAHGATSVLAGIDDAVTFTGKTMTGAANTFSEIPQSAITDLVSDLGLKALSTTVTAGLALKESLANKGVASGYAELDASALVPFAQLPVGSGASQVPAGTHTHVIDAITSATVLTAQTLLDGDPVKELATVSLAAGTWLIFATCKGVTLGTATRTRYQFDLTTDVGTLVAKPVATSSDTTTLNGGGNCIGLLVNASAANVDFTIEKNGTGAQATNSTIGCLVAVPLFNI